MRRWAVFRKLRGFIGAWKTDFYVLYLAIRDERTPLPPKLIAVLLAAYVVSPVDFVSDFIPLLGYVDDAIAVPAGTLLALRLVPAAVLADCRRRAESEPLGKRLQKLALRAMAGLVVLTLALYLLWRMQQ
ncbi:MAG: DUF1232 domain-containing protein [Sporomusaceae bacterium]|nr:DUF1232 domain-containing protein [Sporomusaceae bacterium]